MSFSTRYRLDLHDRMLRVVDLRPGVPVAGARTPRGRVRGLSGKSRMRLIRILAQVSRMDEAVFVTLTYREFTEDFECWKSDIHRWVCSLRHRYPDVCGVWRLEFQSRGAAHFHLLLWGCVAPDIEELERDMSRRWCRATRDLSPAHSEHGCKVIAVSDYRACAFYVSVYQSKDCQDRRDIVTGRPWGVWGRCRLGLEPSESLGFHRGDFVLYRRALRGLYRAYQRRSGKPSQSRYGRSLGRDRPLTTFLPISEASRLARWVLRRSDEVMRDLENFSFESGQPRTSRETG